MMPQPIATAPQDRRILAYEPAPAGCRVMAFDWVPLQDPLHEAMFWFLASKVDWNAGTQSCSAFPGLRALIPDPPRLRPLTRQERRQLLGSTALQTSGPHRRTSSARPAPTGAG